MSACPATHTNHHLPWALVRRGGATPGKKQPTRMAFLVSTIAPNGTAVALTGFIADKAMNKWTKAPRRIEWTDIVMVWKLRPTPDLIKRADKKMADKS